VHVQVIWRAIELFGERLSAEEGHRRPVHPRVVRRARLQSTRRVQTVSVASRVADECNARTTHVRFGLTGVRTRGKRTIAAR